ncbi:MULTISPECIES: WG repeat-containing protein [unclassified Mannheimia]|uniref:WG repeat-containing protein n=1 Tax=unclassified Mannheimia TaxID=2645054 RepID=UPI00359D4651
MSNLNSFKKKYDDVIECVSYSLLIVAKNGKYGVVDRYSKKEVIPLMYDEIKERYCGGYSVRNGQHYGIINDENELLVPIEYDLIEDSGWVGMMQNGNKYAFYKLDNPPLPATTKITPLKYDSARLFNKGNITIFSVSGKYGILNNGLEEIIPAIYDDIAEIHYADSENKYLAVACLNRKYGVIDEFNNKMLEFKYNSLEFIGDTLLIKAVLNHKSGFFSYARKYGILIYGEGNVKNITELKYDSLIVNEEDIVVSVDKKYGFLDLNGREIISPKFDDVIFPFIKERAYVELDGDRFFVDKSGRKIINYIPNELSRKIRILSDNIEKLYNYLMNDEVARNQSEYSLYYWQMPYALTTLDDIPENYSYQKEYEQYNQLRCKMRLEQVDNLPEILKNGLHYPVLSIDFTGEINTEYYKGDANIFFAILNEENRLHLTYYISLFGEKYVDLFDKSKSFDFDSLTDEEISLFSQLLDCIEKICNDLEIETEQNQGVFIHQEFNREEDIARLIQLLNFDDHLTKSEVNKFKKAYIELTDTPDKFRKKLERWLDYEKDELLDVAQDDLYYELITYFIDNNVDDWKFDIERLSDFISNKIGVSFSITDDDYQKGIEYINQNLEAQSDYSILNIVSGGDDVNFIVVRTEDKSDILELSKRLNMPIVDY